MKARTFDQLLCDSVRRQALVWALDPLRDLGLEFLLGRKERRREDGRGHEEMDLDPVRLQLVPQRVCETCAKGQLLLRKRMVAHVPLMAYFDGA